MFGSELVNVLTEQVCISFCFDLYKVNMVGCELVNVIMQHMCISFRREDLKHYKKLYTTRLPEITHDFFVSECIHDNINMNILI